MLPQHPRRDIGGLFTVLGILERCTLIKGNPLKRKITYKGKSLIKGIAAV